TAHRRSVRLRRAHRREHAAGAGARGWRQKRLRAPRWRSRADDERASRYAEHVSNEALALGITFLIHVIGACVLLGLLLRSDGGGWRDWGPRGHDDHGTGAARGHPLSV